MNKTFSICYSHANTVYLLFGGFLTAMRQEVTRANQGWALDTVTLNNVVLKDSVEEITASPPVS